MKHAFTIDIEDWFHQIGTGNSIFEKSNWDNLESRVSSNTAILLDLLDKYSVKATFFILGYIADKNPNLIKEIANRGHEIASHGYYHDPVYMLKPSAFYTDVLNTKSLLENLTGYEVLGYRAPSFSIIEETDWAYDELTRAGYRYSSSVFPSKRFNGGWENYNINNKYSYSKIIEYPIVMPNGVQKYISPIGGGYFRLFPRYFYDWYLKSINQSSIFYIHPRDIDCNQPKIDSDFIRRTRAYTGIKSCLNKIEYIIKKHQWGSMREVFPEITLNLEYD